MSQTPTEQAVLDAARELDGPEFTRSDLADKLDIDRGEFKDGFKANRKAGRIEKVRENDEGKGLFRVAS